MKFVEVLIHKTKPQLNIRKNILNNYVTILCFNTVLFYRAPLKFVNLLHTKHAKERVQF